MSPRDITCFVLRHPSFGGDERGYESLNRTCALASPCRVLCRLGVFGAALRPPPFDRVLYITRRCQTIWLIVVISLSFNKSKSTNPGAEEESLATPIWKQKKLIPPDTCGHLLQSAEIYPAALVPHLCQPETGSLMLEKLFTFCFFRHGRLACLHFGNCSLQDSRTHAAITKVSAGVNPSPCLFRFRAEDSAKTKQTLVFTFTLSLQLLLKVWNKLTYSSGKT